MSEQSGGRWEFDAQGNVHYVPPEGRSDGSGDSSQNEAAQNNSQYHYSYKHNDSRNTSRPSRRSSKGNDTGWHWIFIILGFMVFWPIGLVLLFLELSGKWPGNQQVEQELHRVGKAAKSAARQAKHSYEAGQTAQQARNTQASPPQEGMSPPPSWVVEEREKQTQRQQKKAAKKAGKKDDGAAYGLGHVKLFRTLGGIMTGVFGFAFLMQLIDELHYFYSLGWLLEETVPLLALCLAGATLLSMANSRTRKLKKFRKYQFIIGARDMVAIRSLAETMGVSQKKAAQDLEEMLERGFFDQGYIDAARDMLVLRDGVFWDAPEEPAPGDAPTDGQEDDNTATATLRRIRQLNDAIANPELSAKIDRIEELTAKIFRLLEERPEKAGELRSFLNYYLPQTLKFLENYAKLEAQGIEGDNIAEVKQKIESMMDKLVDGYEAQLDKLFADDVLDISADLKVMEDMLAKDGLTADNELKF